MVTLSALPLPYPLSILPAYVVHLHVLLGICRAIRPCRSGTSIPRSSSYTAWAVLPSESCSLRDSLAGYLGNLMHFGSFAASCSYRICPERGLASQSSAAKALQRSYMSTSVTVVELEMLSRCRDSRFSVDRSNEPCCAFCLPRNMRLLLTKACVSCPLFPRSYCICSIYPQ